MRETPFLAFWEERKKKFLSLPLSFPVSLSNFTLAAFPASSMYVREERGEFDFPKEGRREFGQLFSFAPLLWDFLKKKSCSFRTGKSAGAKSIPRDTWPTDEGSKMLSKRKSCKYLTFIKIAYPSRHAAPSKIVRVFSLPKGGKSIYHHFYDLAVSPSTAKRHRTSISSSPRSRKRKMGLSLIFRPSLLSSPPGVKNLVFRHICSSRRLNLFLPN